MSDYENVSVEESPRKKRKVSVCKIGEQTSRPTASSTPRPTASSTPRPTVSSTPRPSALSELQVSEFVEPSVIVAKTPGARKNLNLSQIATREPAAKKHVNTENKENANGQTLLSFLDSSLSSLAETSLSMGKDDDELDYDDFFIKCKRIVFKGAIWELYKPIEPDDKASLYYQITTDPRKAKGFATWFSDYCQTKPTHVGTCYLYQLYFDCAGYQKFNIRKCNEFKVPINVDLAIEKLNDDDFTNSMVTTQKFLFAEKTRLGLILKYGIYNFLQKFIISSQELLGGVILNRFIELLIGVCKGCSIVPLVYTAFIFVMKILTGLCMLRTRIAGQHEYVVKVDDLITKLYIIVVSMRLLNVHHFVSLKTAAINELKLWVQYYPNIFLNHFNCGDFLKYLMIDESRIVRLATAECCMSIVQSDEVARNLSTASIELLSKNIWLRTSDVDDAVALNAFKIYSEMIKRFPEYISKEAVNEKLIETVFHKDFRIGSAAGNCVYQLLLQETNDPVARLTSYCKISNFHPKLKSYQVESLIDHDPVLQNWELYVKILITPNENKFPIPRMVVLTELILEAAHVSLTGCSTKTRLNSKTVRSIHFDNNDLLANALYRNIQEIVRLHYRNNDIMTNVLKILMKVAPNSMKEEHLKIADELITGTIVQFFVRGTDNNALATAIDYLLYISNSVLSDKSTTEAETAIKYLKGCVCDFLESHKSKNCARQLAVLFTKVDLTEQIEWTKLLNSWQYLNTDAEFVENILIACQWSLIWTLNKNVKSSLDKNISAMKTKFSQYFSVCYELFTSEDKDIRLKTFNRICESYITLALEVEKLSKANRVFNDLKPTLVDDAILRSDILEFFEQNIDAVTEEDSPARFEFILNIYKMACMEILPVHSISVILKYYDKYHEQYGTIIETILTNIFEKNENWLPLLIVNSLSLCFEDLMEKYGVVDYSSYEAKQVSRLSHRFYNFRKIFKGPKTAAKMLIYAINYAAKKKYYDFLIYLTRFIGDVQNFPADVETILNTVRERVPESDTKNDALLYFVDHLKQPTKNTTSVKKVVPRKAPKNPKLKPQNRDPKKKQKPLTKSTPKSKGKAKASKKLSQQSTETEGSDHMSIHDSSDNLLDSEME